MAAVVQRHPAAAIAAVVAAAYLIALTLLPASLAENESTDYSLFYEPVARSLLAGDGFERADGEPGVRYPPGFPVVLAVPLQVADTTGLDDDTALRLATAVTMGASAGVLFLLGRRLFGGAAALAGTVLWALYPLNLWVAKQPNSEVPFTLALLLALLAAVVATGDHRRRPAAFFGVGVLVAVTVLIRPAGLALLPPLLWWTWRHRVDRRAALQATGAILAGLLALVLPWVVWASAASDQLVPLSTGGRDTVVDGLEVGIGQKGTEEGRTLAMPADLRSLLEDLSAQDGEGELPTTGSAAAAVTREVPERPVAVAELVLMKAARSWYGTESLRHERLVVLAQLPFVALMAWGAWRAGHRGGEVRRGAQLLLGLLGCSWLLTMAVISLVRYLTPSVGAALLLGGVALAPAVESLRGRLARDQGPEGVGGVASPGGPADGGSPVLGGTTTGTDS